jgi:hypothetical protein
MISKTQSGNNFGSTVLAEFLAEKISKVPMFNLTTSYLKSLILNILFKRLDQKFTSFW